MNLGRIAGPLVGIAATVGAGALGGPAAATLVGSSLLGGKAAKEGGKKIEERTGKPVQKIAAPAAAVAVPALVSALGIDPETLCSLADAVSAAVCAGGPIGVGAGTGALGVLLHSIVHGGREAARGRTTKR